MARPINLEKIKADGGNEKVAKAVIAAGGLSKVAELLGYASHWTVGKWCRSVKVPAHHVVRLCELAGGGGYPIQPHEVRPDVFPLPAEA